MGRNIRITGNDLEKIINESTTKIVKTILQNHKKQVQETKRADKFANKIFESVSKKLRINKTIKLNESSESGLWAEIRFVQGGDDDYEQISQMFCGDNDAYCEANAQPVIDYLKQWDDGECEITANQPRIARHDTSYADENGEYTLLYNSSIGGDFLLYRPANEQEIAWYEDNQSLNEGIHRYKGFKCVNTSTDPSFPTYAIVSPEGETIETTLFPSEMKEIVDNYLKGNLNESVEYDDYAAVSDALAQCGWAYTDTQNVRNNKTGQEGIRYVIEPYPNNIDGIEPLDVEEMKQQMKQLIGENNVIFSEGQHRYAPEIKNLSMVVINSNF